MYEFVSQVSITLFSNGVVVFRVSGDIDESDFDHK